MSEEFEGLGDLKRSFWKEMMPERIFVAVMSFLLTAAAVAAMFFLFFGLLRSNWNMVIGMAAVEAFVVFFYFFSFRALKRTFNVLRQWCKDKDSECVVLINGLRALKGLPPVEDEPEEDESENTEDKTEQP